MKEQKLDSPPEDGVYIYGLFVDGGRWNAETHALDEAHPKVLYDVMPVVSTEQEIHKSGCSNTNFPARMFDSRASEIGWQAVLFR